MKIDQNSVAVVTGGANGIGFALGRRLVDRGARVALADVDGARAVAAAAGFGGSARGYACDVTDPQQLAALASDVDHDFGGVDLLFANAGVVIGGTLVETDPREVEWLYDVNVRGVIGTIQAFYPAIRARAAERGAARIVLTGSENSLGLPSLAPSTVYTSTKHAVMALADALRRDTKDSGIGVSIFCPGLTATKMWDARANRQPRYGGPLAVPEEQAARAKSFVASAGQDPGLTARICLDGIEHDEFLIICDPAIRQLAERRHAEVATALARIDARLQAYGETPSTKVG
jgi:NAD(P)-dependent dehydrogenase (short-subunit alcohol dehydrogenase family)